MLNLLQLLRDIFRREPQQPTIYSYGHEYLQLSEQEMQPVMEWLFLSLLNAGYSGEAHLCWYDNENPEPGIEGGMLEGVKRKQPVLGYRFGGRMWELPEGYHWRMMLEHPSMRIYQLGADEDFVRLRESNARENVQDVVFR